MGVILFKQQRLGRILNLSVIDLESYCSSLSHLPHLDFGIWFCFFTHTLSYMFKCLVYFVVNTTNQETILM